MIETKEDYQQLNGMLADTIDEVDHSALLETIEALRDALRKTPKLKASGFLNVCTWCNAVYGHTSDCPYVVIPGWLWETER